MIEVGDTVCSRVDIGHHVVFQQTFAQLDHRPYILVSIYYIRPFDFAQGHALVIFPIPLHVRLFLFAEKAPPISPEVAADRHHPKSLCTILLLVVTTRLRLVGVSDVD